MANLLTGPVIVDQGLTLVSTIQQLPLGTKGRDTAGNEYVYVSGVTSGAVGYACVIDETGAVTLLVGSGAVGPVGVMVSALTASTYGWVQVYGKATIYTVGDVADNGLVNSTATAGQVDDASTVRVLGAVFRAARTGAGLTDAQLVYPTYGM